MSAVADVVVVGVASVQGRAHDVMPGWFVLDQHLKVRAGEVRLHEEASVPPHPVVDMFSAALGDETTINHRNNRALPIHPECY